MELKIILKGKPLNEEYEFSKFVQMVQEFVFVNKNWEREEKLEDLISRFKQLRKINEPIEMVYRFQNEIAKDELSRLQKTIIREAELRAFKCNISIHS